MKKHASCVFFCGIFQLGAYFVVNGAYFVVNCAYLEKFIKNTRLEDPSRAIKDFILRRKRGLLSFCRRFSLL